MSAICLYYHIKEYGTTYYFCLYPNNFTKQIYQIGTVYCDVFTSRDSQTQTQTIMALLFIKWCPE